jgi:hypothetical protein
MVIIVLLIALMIELGIIMTAPDPFLSEEMESADNKTVSVIPETVFQPKIPKPNKALIDLFKNVFKPKIKPDIAEKPQKPEIKPDPAPVYPQEIFEKEAFNELSKSMDSVLRDLDKNVEVKPRPKKTKEMPAFKPLFQRLKEEQPKPKEPEVKAVFPPENIKTIIEKPKKPANEQIAKEDVIEFMKKIYEGKETPDGWIDPALAAGEDKLALKFFNSIANTQGGHGPLFLSRGEGKWKANYPLSFILTEIIPRVHFHFHEKKKNPI